MENLNSTSLSGRLTRDAELSYTQGGTAILKFSVACNRRKKNGEQWEDEAHFFDILKWKGEGLAPYLTKGKQVIIRGRLTQDRWEAQDGTKRSKVYITAEHIELVGDAKQSSGSGQPVSQYDPKAAPKTMGGSAKFEDDIPF